METRKLMPGLKQAGKIAHDRLKNHLEKFDLLPREHMPSLWIQKTQPISFTLVVDYYGIKYSGKKHAQNIINELQKK